MSTYSLSGSGTQALSANTTALHISITTLPSSAGQGRGNPATYYDVGLLRFGDGTGWWDAVPIVGGPQWLGVPPGCTVIGYALFRSAVISVVEVIGGVSPFVGPAGSPGATGATGATGAAGPAGTIPYSAIALAADVTPTPANTYVDVLTLSLAGGTWVLIGQAECESTVSGPTLTLQLTDNTNVVSSGSASLQAANIPQVVTLVGIATFVSTTTWRMRAAGTTVNGRIRAAAHYNGVGNNATRLVGLKIA